MSRVLSQPVTQMLSWSFGLLLVSGFAAVIRRTQPSGWQVGLLSACALLGTQEIGPALAAVGITWTLVVFRRDGARAVVVQAAIAGICGLTVIALYYDAVLRSSPMELVNFFRIDVPFTQALMHYPPNTWAGSWCTASRVAGPLWVASLASAAYLGTTAMIPRRAENPWPIFWTLFFVGAFLFPASQEFIFARFFAGLTVSAPVVTALAIRQAAQVFWQSPRAET